MVTSTQLKDCAFQMKRTLLHHLEILFSYGCSFHLFYFLWQDRFHLGSEQFDFVYAIYQHYTKDPAELISDFFAIFLLWIWHFIVLNLICSIEITPLDTVCIDQATLSYSFWMIRPYFLLLHIHYLLASVLTGELPGHMH